MSKIDIKVPYVDIAGQHAALKPELMEAIASVIDQGDFILGDEVEAFEHRFAELCEVRYAIGVNSGTDALMLALNALGVGLGDEVITAPNSFVATTSAIVLAGATPVFADVGEDYNLDPNKFNETITPRTKAVIPVHLTGRPAEMDSINEIAKAHGLHVVEDSAQAVLAEYKGRSVGSLGTIGCFSLHPLKTLNACGDAGIITTNDEMIYERVKNLRNLGLVTRNECRYWSGNSRLDSLQAAILMVKTSYLEGWTEKRRENAAYYQATLRDVSQLKLPMDREYEKAVYHTFIIQTDRRDELKEYLSSKGIETSVHYPIPIHLQKAASSLGYEPGSFPVTEGQATRVLSLPVSSELSEDQRAYVVRTIQEFYY